MENKLDLETVNVLKEALGEEFSSLIDVFLSDAPKRILEIRECFAAGDIASVEMPVHTFKGSSGNIGAIALSQACAVLLDAVKAGDSSNIEQLISDIQIEFDIVKALFEAM